VNVLFVEVDGQLSGSGYLQLTSTTTTMTDAQSAQVRWLLDPDPLSSAVGLDSSPCAALSIRRRGWATCVGRPVYARRSSY